MIYLIEISAYDPAANGGAGGETILRYGSETYVTQPGDDPSNAEFVGRVSDPGNFERHLFGRGRTFGRSEVGHGVIKLANPDGQLDDLLDMTFDGRTVRIFGLADRLATWSSRQMLFSGRLDQAEFAYREVSIRIRDRLDVLRETLQRETYAGTTVNGGLAEAEGTEDLKDKPKPELFGRVLSLNPIEADGFDLIYDVGVNGLSAVTAVRDRGVELTATSDYADLAALKAASLTGGQYATCLALGKVALGSKADGVLTIDALEGATLADRSAGRVARRILERFGLVADVDFDAASFEALHVANPAEVGIWIGTQEADALNAVSAILESVGGYLVPDRSGLFHVGRLTAPSGTPAAEIDEILIFDAGSGIDRLATSDEGGGVAAQKVTIRYGFNLTPLRQDDLDKTATTDAHKAFAVEEWRQVAETSAPIAAISPDAPELSFDTLLVDAADAAAEAARRLALYGQRRDLFQIELATDVAPGADLGGVIELAIPRFGLAGGRAFRVIGETATYETGTVSLLLWG